MNLLEFIHFSVVSAKSGCIEIKDDGIEGAAIFLDKGKLKHVIYDGDAGEAALVEILKREPKDFALDQKKKCQDETITRPTELILMEAAVSLDKIKEYPNAPQSEKEGDKKQLQKRIRKTTSFNVLAEAGMEKKIYVLDADEITMGRSIKCDIVLADNRVSSQHCMIKKNGDDVLLRDSRSTNGTYLNGVVIEKDEVLKDHDLINVGPVRLKFYRDSFGNPTLIEQPRMESETERQTEIIDVGDIPKG